MSERANRFLIELSQDPAKMADFWRNPDSLLAAADLTAEEKEVLRSGDSTRLQALLGQFGPAAEYEDQAPKPKPKPQPQPKPKPPQPKPKPKPKTEAA